MKSITSKYSGSFAYAANRVELIPQCKQNAFKESGRPIGTATVSPVFWINEYLFKGCMSTQLQYSMNFALSSSG